ncbi:MAG: PilZ domain-containing protein [Myxococcales bacterium]
MGWGSGQAASSAPRFRVQYRLAERLVQEVARCLNGGFVTLDVPAEVYVGTRFAFELSAWQLRDTVELEAVALASMWLSRRRYRVALRYWVTRRAGLDEALYGVLRSMETEPMRSAPRFLVQLPALSDDGSPAYLVQDLSLGGAGVEVQGLSFPPGLETGTPVRLAIVLDDGQLLKRSGKVVWRRPFGAPGCPDRWRPAFGVELDNALDGDGLEALDRVLMLKTSPRCTQLSLG